MLGQSEIPLEQLLGPYGLLAFLLFGVVMGGIRKWWVFGWTYTDLQKDRDEWKAIATRGVGTAQQAAETLETAVKNTSKSEEEIVRETVAELRRRGQIS